MTTDTVNTAALWASVDKITEPTSRRINRDDAADWLDELAHEGQGSFCRVADYRAATLAYGKIPSLWSQATWALSTGTEQPEGGGRSPLRERSPADLDLMETMLTIRESMAWQLPGRGIVPRGNVPAQMRQLASHIASHEPQHVQWWTYRFEQWARVLAKHLQAVDQGPKPVRLRNAPCPACGVREVILETEQGDVVAPPIEIDFVNGWIRAATCTACGYTKWRGQDLWDLADEIVRPPRNHADTQDLTA